MWGIVTEVRSDKEWVGAGINGRTDIPILTSCGHQVWALSSSEPKLTERQANLRLFKAGVRRIRGEADPRIASHFWRKHFNVCHLEGGRCVARKVRRQQSRRDSSN